MCYIPTKRILAEGGYEADQSMVYYGMKGPFKDNVEEKIFSAIEFVMRKTHGCFYRTRIRNPVY